ncbi:[Fe-Fe] hydrogenase large subunit C-terminal domain-containing protein, partial [Enterocloster bolteae]|uniref:[Fe-Fe] hydrogenase large subunit C-terminal domain-containing protein n=1 Tax=Enterocloster bolteae TaxID=208479 RepID=UPI00272F05BB
YVNDIPVDYIEDVVQDTFVSYARYKYSLDMSELKECRKLLTMAKAGKYNGYLLEGMACPGGCVAGAGTIQPIKKSQASVNLYASKAKHKTSNETE